MNTTEIAAPESTQNAVQRHIKALLSAMCKNLYERDEAVKLALLATIAGESIFLLGPPGVGKSLIARRLKYAFKEGKSFEYLMSKFSTPDEIFGPISIKKLKEEDAYERIVDRYLPDANIVFLDEIWKAGPAIQNALLTILNEKIYRNGTTDLKVDIRGIIAASNELPPNNSNLAPIWDRFLLRLELGNIKKFSTFLGMITDVEDVYEDNVPEDIQFTSELLEEWSAAINEVALPPEALNTIQIVKMKLAEYNAKGLGAPIVVHDRRWKKIVRVMRTAAFLNGRSAVNLMDCFLMSHCLWSNPDQKIKIQEILNDTIRAHGYTMAVNLNSLKREVEDYETEITAEIKVKYTIEEAELKPYTDEYFKLLKEDNKMPGVYIKITDYRKLQIGQPSILNIYDEDYSLVQRLSATKASQPNAVEIQYDSQQNTYQLDTLLVSRYQIINKKPHPLLQKHWDERYQSITAYIQQQLDRIRTDAAAQITSLRDHLFVETEKADIVLSNLQEVSDALEGCKLRLEKIQFAYTNISADQS